VEHRAGIDQTKKGEELLEKRGRHTTEPSIRDWKGRIERVSVERKEKPLSRSRRWVGKKRR